MKDNNMEEIYEGNIPEVENQDMIPVETDEADDAGMSTGAVVFLTALATSGLIWLGCKIKEKIDKRKADKAAAEAVEADEADYDEEPAETSEEA
jgi:hypothetical protein